MKVLEKLSIGEFDMLAAWKQSVNTKVISVHPNKRRESFRTK